MLRRPAGSPTSGSPGVDGRLANSQTRPGGLPSSRAPAARRIADRIVIAEDAALFPAGLSLLLETRSTGSAHDVADGMRQLCRGGPAQRRSWWWRISDGTPDLATGARGTCAPRSSCPEPTRAPPLSPCSRPRHRDRTRRTPCSGTRPGWATCSRTRVGRLSKKVPDCVSAGIAALVSAHGPGGGQPAPRPAGTRGPWTTHHPR